MNNITSRIANLRKEYRDRTRIRNNTSFAAFLIHCHTEVAVQLLARVLSEMEREEKVAESLLEGVK